MSGTAGWDQQHIDDLKREGHRDKNEQRKRSLSAGASVPATHMEHHPGDALAQPKAACRFDPSRSFKLRATQYRRRLTDIDGGSIKATLDAIVCAGVIKDDSPEIIKSFEIRQFKI